MSLPNSGPSCMIRPRRYGMTGSLSYGRRARARDKVAEAAYDSRVDSERGVRAADERNGMDAFTLSGRRRSKRR